MTDHGRTRSPDWSRRIAPIEPSWLEANLVLPSLRVLDVRTNPDRRAAEPFSLRRTAAHIDFRGFGYLDAPAGWRPSGHRHPQRADAHDAFTEGHVPGAVSFDVREKLFDDDGHMISAPELAMTMSHLGVGDEHKIVLVDEGRPSDALAAAWVFDHYGHANVGVLVGGFARWIAEGRRVVRYVARYPAASFTAKVRA